MEKRLGSRRSSGNCWPSPVRRLSIAAAWVTPGARVSTAYARWAAGVGGFSARMKRGPPSPMYNAALAISGKVFLSASARLMAAVVSSVWRVLASGASSMAICNWRRSDAGISSEGTLVNSHPAATSRATMAPMYSVLWPSTQRTLPRYQAVSDSTARAVRLSSAWCLAKYWHSKGVTVTASTSDSSSAIAITMPMLRRYSPVSVLESTRGMKVRMMASEDTNSGTSIVRPASAAAWSRGSPSARRRSMSSATTMALSTNRPSAMMMAPTEMMCRSMFSSFMMARVPSTVVGTMAPTISPVRRPRNSTTTAITMRVVSKNTWPTCVSCLVTIWAWSVMGTRLMPTGNWLSRCCTCARRFLAKLTTFRPGSMDTAITAAGVPSTNAPDSGGSCGVRSMRAMFLSSIVPPWGSAIGVVPRSAGVRASPLTVSEISVPAMSMKPAAATTLREATARSTALGLRPLAAMAATSSTICTCSSRTPCSDTRSTPGTLSRSSRILRA